MVAPAAPTEPRANGTAKDEHKDTFLNRVVQALRLPAGSLVVALIIGAVVVIGIGKNPFDAYGALLCGGLAIGCPEGINPAYQLSETVVSMTPLVLAGLAVAISFRAGLFNIGAQGQLLMGAIFATFAGVYLGGLPGIILIPIVILAGALGGAIWGGIVGVLKATTGANEVVTTIMLNYVALYFEKFLIVGGPFQLPNLTSTSPSISDSAKLPHLLPASGEVLGLPGSVFRVNLGIVIALLIAWGFWFLMQRTSLGYEIRAVGQSQRAARYAGVSVRSNIIVTMLIAGALAGVAGAVKIAGISFNLKDIYDVDTTGFDAIAVALLGQNTAIGVVLAALLFGALHVGGQFMQSQVNISSHLVDILQAIILFSLAANFLAQLKIRFPWSAKPSAVTPAPSVAPPQASPPEGGGPAQPEPQPTA